jgi:hypothetical protein
MSEYIPLCATWQDRQATYTTDGLPVIWDRALLPIPYMLQLDEGQRVYASAAHDAAKLWNREVGFPVLHEVGDVASARVFIVSGSCTDPGLAVTSHTGDVVPDSATVELRNVGNLGIAYAAMVHELGHVLGLAEAESGCMGPLPGEDFDPASTWWLPRDCEIEYLRSVYHR